MNNEYTKLKLDARECLNQMSIIDGDAQITKILLELSETNESNIEIKKLILDEIHKLLIVKSKFKIKNDDFYYLKTLSEKLKKDFNLDNDELNNLLNIIKNNF